MTNNILNVVLWCVECRICLLSLGNIVGNQGFVKPTKSGMIVICKKSYKTLIGHALLIPKT